MKLGVSWWVRAARAAPPAPPSGKDMHAALVCDLVEALRTCGTLAELREAVARACDVDAPDTMPDSAPSWDVDSEQGREFGV